MNTVIIFNKTINMNETLETFYGFKKNSPMAKEFFSKLDQPTRRAPDMITIFVWMIILIMFTLGAFFAFRN